MSMTTRRSGPPLSKCQQQLLELSAYLEGDLTPAKMAGLDAHLESCECCASTGGQPPSHHRAVS